MNVYHNSELIYALVSVKLTSAPCSLPTHTEQSHPANTYPSVDTAHERTGPYTTAHTHAVNVSGENEGSCALCFYLLCYIYPSLSGVCARPSHKHIDYSITILM